MFSLSTIQQKPIKAAQQELDIPSFCIPKVLQKICNQDANSSTSTQVKQKGSYRDQVQLQKEASACSASYSSTKQGNTSEESMTGIVISSDLKQSHRNREYRTQILKAIGNSETQTSSESEFKVPLPPTKDKKYCLFLPVNPSDKRTKKQLLVKRSSLEQDCSGINGRPNFNKEVYLRKTNLKKAVKKTVGRWSGEEIRRLNKAVEIFGSEWAMVEEFVGTRNRKQVENQGRKVLSEIENNSKGLEISNLDKKVSASYDNQQILWPSTVSQAERNLFLLSPALIDLDFGVKLTLEKTRQSLTLLHHMMVSGSNQASIRRIQTYIDELREEARDLMTVNCSNKRQEKAEAKSQLLTSQREIQARFKQVQVDMWQKLGVTSFDDLSNKFGKLSQWVEGPISTLSEIRQASLTEENLNKQATSPFTHTIKGLNQQIERKSAALQLEKNEQISVHHLISIKIPPAFVSLEGTSTSLSQISDNDHIEDCCTNEHSEGLSHLELDENNASRSSFFSKVSLPHSADLFQGNKASTQTFKVREVHHY